MNVKEKFVAYYRVSTVKQGQSGLGLEAQKAAVEGYLESRGGDMAGEFVEVESGKRKNRPQLNAALALCKKVKGTLVIAKLDRLARNLHLISGLMESRIDFVAVDNPNANRLTVHILAAVAEEEARAISSRTKAALASAKARGVILGRNGAKLGQENRAKAIVAAAALCDTIAKLKADGVSSVREIALRLNVLQIPTAQGKRWHPTSVHRLIKRLEAA